MVIISSPYARRGELYKTWARHYGPDGDPLIMVAHGPSRLLNPNLPQRIVDRALERDEAVARAEYLAEFRSDLEAFLTVEAVRAVTAAGVHERSPKDGLDHIGFVDPSGGSLDSMTLGIAHAEGETAILDLVREVKPPFDPAQVVGTFARTLKAYGIDRVTGDRYGAEWVASAFGRAGIVYQPSERSRSELYLELLPMVNSGRVSLLDHKRLSSQLTGLERRTSRGGRDSVDHAPGGHDDLANAAAGSLVVALAQGASRPSVTLLRLDAKGFRRVREVA
ncbi:hypothetical protein ACFQU1_04895 [Chelatococcus sp. GCM10030263]|uniref:hypothetical protein n=1 Tax=Chelatococcus sp. GCM10030263 TaxID=3273387 RepID=UPI00361A5381